MFCECVDTATVTCEVQSVDSNKVGSGNRCLEKSHFFSVNRYDTQQRSVAHPLNTPNVTLVGMSPNSSCVPGAASLIASHVVELVSGSHVA